MQLECILNLRSNTDRGPLGRWIFKTSVLRECPAHAGAFSATEMERILTAITNNDIFEDKVQVLDTHEAIVREPRRHSARLFCSNS